MQAPPTLLAACFHIWQFLLALGRAHLLSTDDCPVPVKAIIVDSTGTDTLSFGPSGNDCQERLATCSVSWISYELLQANHDVPAENAADGALLSRDFVLTDALKWVPFAGRSGRIAFLERILPMPRMENERLDSILAAKDLLVSVLLPRKTSVAWADMQTRIIAEQVMAVLPDHTFVDDGLAATYEQAFEPYRFSLIVDDNNDTVSQALIHCIGWGTIPLFNGFSHIVAMLPRVVVPWDRAAFRVETLLTFLPSINHGVAALWQQHRLIQDQLLYRYSRGFNASLRAAACHLCSYKQAHLEDALKFEDAEDVEDVLPPLVFVGVYSAQENVQKRQAIRRTWARPVRTHGFDLKFFLGRPHAHLVHVKAENAIHKDVILLDVQEGYRWNSIKGLMFLEWCAMNVLARFIVKADDDVYLRPDPLVLLLKRRPSFGYVWGYFDYFSPVPEDEHHAFFNSEDIYPFAVFPPYARGLLRVLSADVVAALANMSLAGKLPVIYGDDPCFGVHLRYLRDDMPGLPMLTLDDRDSYRIFAMEPSCSPALWSHASQRSWIIHHVSPEQVECMWAADLDAGMYQLDGIGQTGRTGRTGNAGGAQSTPAVLEVALAAASFATQERQAFEEPPPFPDICECLEFGPMAAELSKRQDKINATRTYLLWGHPSLLDREMLE